MYTSTHYIAVNGHLHTLADFCPRFTFTHWLISAHVSVPLDQKVRWSQGLSGHGNERRNPCPYQESKSRRWHSSPSVCADSFRTPTFDSSVVSVTFHIGAHQIPTNVTLSFQLPARQSCNSQKQHAVYSAASVVINLHFLATWKYDSIEYVGSLSLQLWWKTVCLKHPLYLSRAMKCFEFNKFPSPSKLS